MCIPPQAGSAPAISKEITEALLAAIWNEQAHLRGPMWDCEGSPVSVVYRGRWTAGTGPDFEGAMLALGEGSTKLVTGSVEMHLRCADWWAHGHHTDPKYNGVVLHVVLWPQSARPVIRADGVSVPTLVLGDYIALRADELLEKVSPLLANLGSLSEEPCWQRTQHWPIEKLIRHVEEAGDERLLAKAALMEADLHVYGSPEEVFYRGLMDALGYSANREQMRAVADALPLAQLLLLPLSKDEHERATLLESVLLGAAGFLPSQRPSLAALDWLSSHYADEAESIWRTYAPLLGLAPDHPLVTTWNIDRVRPANAPARRLAAAARLLARLLWTEGGILGSFVNTPARLSTASLAKRWTQALQVAGEGYWASHSDFGRALDKAAREDTALVGSSRASDLLVNVLLPLLIATADRVRDPLLRQRAMDVYARYPKLAENKITRTMSEEAFGPLRKKAVKGARHQQGLIHLYKLYCQSRRCYECPISGARSNLPIG